MSKWEKLSKLRLNNAGKVCVWIRHDEIDPKIHDLYFNCCTFCLFQVCLNYFEFKNECKRQGRSIQYVWLEQMEYFESEFYIQHRFQYQKACYLEKWLLWNRGCQLDDKLLTIQTQIDVQFLSVSLCHFHTPIPILVPYNRCENRKSMEQWKHQND